MDNPITPRGRMTCTVCAIAVTNGFTLADLTGPSRKPRIYRVRCMAYRALFKQGKTRTAIGKFMGGRDHSTVAHGLTRDAF